VLLKQIRSHRAFKVIDYFEEKLYFNEGKFYAQYLRINNKGLISHASRLWR